MPLPVAELEFGPEPVFFTPLYEDAAKLLTDARECIASVMRTDLPRMSPEDQLAFSREAFRVTARLTQSMAWLMAQRAVSEGEISSDQARGPRYRLGQHRVCLSRDNGRLDGLPPALKSVWWRSCELFKRIARIESDANERRRAMVA